MLNLLRSPMSPCVDHSRIRPSLEGLVGRNLMSTGNGWLAPELGDGPA